MSYRTSPTIPFGSRYIPYQFRAPNLRVAQALSGLGRLTRGMGTLDYAAMLQAPPNEGQGWGTPNMGGCTPNTWPGCDPMYQASKDLAEGWSQANSAQFERGVTNYMRLSGGTLPQWLLLNLRGGQTLPQAALPIPDPWAASQAAQQLTPAQQAAALQQIQSWTPTQYSPPDPQYASDGGAAFEFINTRGGSSLRPGDTWRLNIRRQTANAPVTVVGGKNGERISNGMGKTDAYGDFTLSGTITSDEVGSWAEDWFVNGQSVGSVTFTVALPPAGTPPDPTMPPTPPDKKAPVNPPADTSAGFSFSDIPMWGWAAAAGAVLLFMGGGRGR